MKAPLLPWVIEWNPPLAATGTVQQRVEEAAPPCPVAWFISATRPAQSGAMAPVPPTTVFWPSTRIS